MSPTPDRVEVTRHPPERASGALTTTLLSPGCCCCCCCCAHSVGGAVGAIIGIAVVPRDAVCEAKGIEVEAARAVHWKLVQVYLSVVAVGVLILLVSGGPWSVAIAFPGAQILASLACLVPVFKQPKGPARSIAWRTWLHLTGWMVLLGGVGLLLMMI